MRKIWTFIKKVLKRLLPPTVHVFMREVNGLHGAMAAREANLSHQLGVAKAESQTLMKMIEDQTARRIAEVGQAQGERLDRMEQEQGKRLDRLSDLFESANRENLRLFFDSREERREMDARYAQLSEEMEKLQARQAELEKQLAEGLSAAEKQLRENKAAVLKGQDQLRESVRSVENSIPNKPILWANGFERGVVSANWGDVSSEPVFAEKYQRLVSGMDEKSIEIIVRLLSRQKKFLNSEKGNLDLFTRGEQEEIRLLKENFYDEILPLSGELYAYRNYLLPVNHFEASVFYYKHGIQELKTADRVKGQTVIDVGGFIGDSVLVLSELKPDRIFTFEAEPSNYSLLRKTLEINHVSNVTAENIALGAEEGELTMHVGGSGSTLIERPGLQYTEDIRVPVIRFDDYVERNDIRNIALIKVDIEGGEPGFLEGAKRTICEQKPILLLSIYHNAHDFFELKPLLENWGLGYKFRIHKPTFGNATSETLLLAEID